ncbi:SPE_1075/MLC_0560 family membrane protein [Spiroplasma monobiae]|uniref:Transmembrane protein n=1 Tax=Spiroplasma monobiae MQ-1 TaxID=1336748 RepID=A0A2K9LVH3_SPISQ|nr:hypothetical protein [Spiroplasma monobiae]AUM63027.1 hypothetical protein SMONO_v1c07780 [Spiroplasma monobiae MQ-1]
MKKILREFSSNITNHWLSILVKFFMCASGVVICSFGLALYQQAAVGGSQIDWTIYNVLALFNKPDENGLMDHDFMLKYYPNSLKLMYLFLMIGAIALSIKPTLKDYKNSKKKIIWFSFTWMIISDILVTLVVPSVVGLFLPWAKGLGVEEKDTSIRNLIFMAGFICFLIGTALWVKTGWFLGPFNNICTQLVKSTNLNYSASRLIIDGAVFAIGFIFFPFIKGDHKTQFLLTNFGLGTICFTFLVGPIVNEIFKLLDKILNFEKMNSLTTKSVFEV